MKRIFLPLAVMLFLAACAGEPAAAPLPVQVWFSVKESPVYEVSDYQNRELGEELPEWVSRYVREGAAGVEALPQYEGFYVFIDADSGTNVYALRQWLMGFNLEQDFPRLLASRIQDRVTQAGAGNPDHVYGRYFERIVKNALDAVYQGAEKTADYWIKKQPVQEDGAAPGQEVYEFLVLVQISRELLKDQLNRVLFQTRNVQAARDQTAALERLKSNFYEGF